MPNDPERFACPHCESLDTEEVIETRKGWGCYCTSCGRTFPVRKTPQEQAEEREAMGL